MSQELDRRSFLSRSFRFGLGAPFVLRSRAWGFDGGAPPAHVDAIVAWLVAESAEGAVVRAARELDAGTSADDLLAAIFVAAVLELPTDTPSFNHVVLVVQSIHRLLESVDAHHARLALLWCVDFFKADQAQEAARGDWTLRSRETKALAADVAERKLIAALDAWEIDDAEDAVQSLAGAAGAERAFSVVVPYGMRSEANLGHPTIFTAMFARVLPRMSWHRGADALRSLVRSYFFRAPDSDRAATFPLARVLAAELPAPSAPSAANERGDDGVRRALVHSLRELDPESALRAVAKSLAAGVASAEIWDALVTAACELVLRDDSFTSLHALTTTNALHTLFELEPDVRWKNLALLQCAAFLPFFRGSRDTGRSRDPITPTVDLDALAPLAPLAPAVSHAPGGERPPVERVFGEVGDPEDALQARAARAISIAASDDEARAFAADVPRLLADRASSVHQFKFGIAVMEELERCGRAARPALLAAATVHLPHPHERPNEIRRRVEAAAAE